MRYFLILSEVAQGLRRNLSMVISVVLVTFVSLTFVGTAAVLQLQIVQMKTFWYDRAQVSIYLCTQFDQSETCDGTDASAEQIAVVENQLKSAALEPYVEEYFFEDHEQAYKNFMDQFQGNPVADYATPDQLNQTFWVKLKDPTQAEVIAESFSGVSGVQSVTDQRSLLDKIFALLNVASYTALSIAALMLVAA